MDLSFRLIWGKRWAAQCKQLLAEAEKVEAEVAKAKEKANKLQEQQKDRSMIALDQLAKAKDQNSTTKT